MTDRTNVNIDSKSDTTSRLCTNTETSALNYGDTTASSSSRQTNHQHHRNYMSEVPKEETKSQRPRNSNFHSLSQHSNANLSQEMQSNNNINNNSNNNTNLNLRYGQYMTRSTTNPLLYHNSTFQHAAPTSKSNLSGDTFNRHSGKHRPSTSSIINNMMGLTQASKDEHKIAHNFRQDQQEKETNEVVAMIKEELEDNLEGFKESELETLSSLEKNLPVELSFLIRQQAYCMARMNYLDRQIRELKETRQNDVPSQANSNSGNQSNRNNVTTHSATAVTSTIANNTTTAAHTKNGNFIPSDDSGGEYSRATTDNDDELTSLLDQIKLSLAKSVRSERNLNPSARTNQQQANFSVTSNPPQPQYAIINPTQLHHQAVPVFVMGSPILAHPSSISSNVLPGVHFQPQAPYNQYYEGFYAPNSSSSPAVHRSSGTRSQQIDITALEQLVSQKEKRQIKSQLKSADNWFKMRSSGLCNLNGNYSNTNSGLNNADGINNPTASAPDDSNSVIEENRSR